MPDWMYDQKRCLIVAELGTCHGGDPARARELVDAAADAGADCAKLQIVFARELLHPLTGEVDLPGGSIPLYRRFEELERGADFYREIKACTEGRGLFFLATPFGIESARIVRDLGCRAVKIASPELNYIQLLREVSGYGIPVVLSTGVSLLADIETALGIVGAKGSLLHCITQYPAPEEEYNLELIPALRRVFGVPVGVSDHSLDPVLVPAAAVTRGAFLVEKHLTLSKTGRGLDDPIALGPDEFAVMAESIRTVERMDGEDATGWLADRFGADRVDRVLGTGRKQLAPSEMANYGRSNRSLHALGDIAAGEPLTSRNVAALRTEHNLSPGLSPRHLATILGKRAARPIADGAGITWEDLLAPRAPAGAESGQEDRRDNQNASRNLL